MVQLVCGLLWWISDRGFTGGLGGGTSFFGFGDSAGGAVRVIAVLPAPTTVELWQPAGARKQDSPESP